MSLDVLGSVPTDMRRQMVLNAVAFKWMSWLAPLVEWLADRHDGAHEGAPVITRSIQGPIRLRPTTRKIIVFDEARTIGVRGFVGACLPGMFAAAFLVGLINRADLTLAILFCASSLPTAAVVAWTLLKMAKRLRDVREEIAQCAVVQGTVTEAELFYRGDVRKPRTDLDLRIRYAYREKWWEAEMTVRPEWALMIGTTPELLVDTHNPGCARILDFYV